jgi:predicted flap endonuclease-1-like 5' DNA nuclease
LSRADGPAIAEIGYAKSIMDYIFRWIQIRFLSGTQLDLFAGLQPPASVAVEGTVTAPGNTVNLAGPVAGGEGVATEAMAGEMEMPGVESEVDAESMSAEQVPVGAGAGDVEPGSATPTAPQALHHTVSSALASWLATSDVSPQAVLQREARAQYGVSDEKSAESGSASGPYDRARMMQENAAEQTRAAERLLNNDRTPPRGGIAPEPAAAMAKDLAARSGIEARGASTMEDRGIYSPSEAMREMYDMGDAPSCATCGAIMTRSGSCYRCMSCGSTSGCS